MQEYFRRRLSDVEASKAAAGNVPRLDRAPASACEFESLRRRGGYEGEPLVFPADSWCPNWRNVLGGDADVSTGLERLLEHSLEVEAYRLHYSCSNDVMDPVPVTTNESMEFSTFVRESKRLVAEATRNELLYLTLRALPVSCDEDTSFDFFLRRLLLPTTSPSFIPTESIRQRNMWMGSIVTSRIHFDALDNLHVCLSGKKVVHLYAPSELRNMYPQPWKEGSLNNFSSVGSLLSAKPGPHDAFLNNTSYLRAEISAGDAIYIPAGWWHEVFTVWGFTTSANAWFDRIPGAQFRPSLMHLKSDKFYKFMLQAS